MRSRSFRKGWCSLFLLAAWLLLISVSTAASQVLSDDFNDNTTNPSVWTPFQIGFGPTVAETNQRLEIAHPANSMETGQGVFMAGYTSVCQLRGDFDIQVDYHLLVWPSANGVRVGLGTGLGATERASLGTSADFPGQPREVYVTDFGDGVFNFISTSDLSGKLRQERSGSTVTGYYFSSGNWVPIHSAPATTADVPFSLASWSQDYAFTDQAVQIAFDNFTVNQGQLICPKITVLIDIKPGDFPNSINLRSRGVIPVAIVTTDTFDATTVDPTTVRFGRTGTEAAPVRSAPEDVDGDGDTDMIFHFNTQGTGIVCGNTSAFLTGETFSGQAIEGSDSIETVACE